MVRSDEPKCPKGGLLKIALSQRRSFAQVGYPHGGCRGLEPSFFWKDPASTIAVKVQVVTVAD